MYTKLEQEQVDFTIRMREYMPSDTYSDLMKVQNQIFEEALEGTDAHATSFNERQATESHDGKEFTYGEVLFCSFIPLIEYVQPQEGELLYDLGCGSGRPMMIASLAFP